MGVPLKTSSSKVKFLLVDDLKENLIALEAMIRREDVEVHVASSGREALELLLVHDYAAAVIDVQMPEMDGFELAELMRGAERTRNVPVIFVTAGDHDRSRVFKGYEAGAVDFLYKPLDELVVRSKLNVFLELDQQKRRVQQQLGATEQALDEVQTVRNILELYSRAGKLLSHSLDRDETLEAIGEVLVPAVADWCVIDWFDDAHDQFKRLWVKHRDPERAEAVQSLLRYPIRRMDQNLINQVFTTREPLLLRQVTEERFFAEEFRNNFFDSSQRELLWDLQMNSVVSVPLIARGKTLGVLTCVRGQSGKFYEDPELRVIQELGNRIGMALDNSTLFFEAQRGIQTRDDFLSIASHELKTPLTSLKLQLQLLRRFFGKDPETINSEELKVLRERLSKVVETSEKQTDKLNSLIDDLLDLTRVVNGRLAIESAEVNFSQLVREVIEHFTPEFKQSGIPLHSSVEDSLWVTCDPVRMEQVIVNLLSNAMKYGAKKPVHVKLSRTPDRLASLCVEDQGIGIQKEKQSLIFDRFEQVTTGRAVKGLGLGLYIAKEIVSAHGASISVQSEPGQGSTFLVEIPLIENRVSTDLRADLKQPDSTPTL